MSSWSYIYIYIIREIIVKIVNELILMGWVGIVAEKWVNSLVGPRPGRASLSVLISTGHTILFFHV